MTPAALARLHAAAFSEDRPWTEAEFAALLDLPGTLLLGDGRAFLLGRVVLDEAEVLTIATDPAHRRQGLASAILATFESDAAARGARQAFLEVAEDNLPARALYDGRGYGRIGRRPAYYARRTGPAVAALVLARPLG
ncbi:GNAT family N-acetyltransferase [Rubellimicrobium arenae]|uniref:GNAT family N-acetyltransferase n=1 Tax=Rubellimicrobium arenae TaxID=2817372 RepID=UPI001B30760E|nr:GNAT family N-acetyltransferase [Rubellimicrobium arenae]